MLQQPGPLLFGLAVLVMFAACVAANLCPEKEQQAKVVASSFDMGVWRLWRRGFFVSLVGAAVSVVTLIMMVAANIGGDLTIFPIQ